MSFKEEKELESLEAETEKIEKQIEGLTTELNSGITDHAKLFEIAIKIKNLKENIDGMTMRWSELTDLKENSWAFQKEQHPSGFGF